MKLVLCRLANIDNRNGSKKMAILLLGGGAGGGGCRLLSQGKEGLVRKGGLETQIHLSPNKP